jgi:hypothetical protein
VAVDPREELITALRAILAAPGTSAKALAAKAQAARQLERLLGMTTTVGGAGELEDKLPPDPMAAAGLDDLAPLRRRRH